MKDDAGSHYVDNENDDDAYDNDYERTI